MKYVKYRILFLSHSHEKRRQANSKPYFLHVGVKYIRSAKNYSVAFNIYLFIFYLISTPKIGEIHRNKNQNNKTLCIINNI